jgi:hypothetical protein
MNKRDMETFVEVQKLHRSRIIARLGRQHGEQTVRLALRNLDNVTDLYPGGADSLPKICKHLRNKRGASRSWNLARLIFVELLKNLADHLEAAEQKQTARRRLNPRVHSVSHSTLQM